MMDVVVKYIDGCRDDLDAANTLLDAGKSYWVGFLCHQALFKLLRGYFLETQNRYPTHEPHLPTLARAAKLDDVLSAQDFDFLHELSFYPQVSSQSVYRQKILQGADGAGELLRRAGALAAILQQLIV